MLSSEFSFELLMTEVSDNPSSSKYLASLMHCAIGAAREFNFHLVHEGIKDELWGGHVRAQLVRRIWWCLMISDR
jgi:hypothetical protein